ncbi:MAG: hypothetical protein WD004_02865 [Actinomycetota bacterium]
MKKWTPVILLGIAQQVESLRVSAFFLLALAVLALLFLSRSIPATRPEQGAAWTSRDG